MSDEETEGQKAYAEYLESETWAKIRAAAIERAGGRCQLCGEEPDTFNVHHNRYPDTWRQGLSTVRKGGL